MEKLLFLRDPLRTKTLSRFAAKKALKKYNSDANGLDITLILTKIRLKFKFTPDSKLLEQDKKILAKTTIHLQTEEYN